ncbi:MULTISPECIES: hypothetical protein [unclassified Methylobacterium]|jgi:hypothetical protein|uniref:hypothetical protein n=1 Tax=unclassified Methylobacterium TaxID=2615210 RepID=UPI001352A2FF|nr:hypothetical protein [Methylobacterium sp. 2A]MWV23729.1 hypothetical protein [Methylobacterium sp. 2A]
MASGYVIAALLEAAGLIGLALALVKLRAEREAKAAELRSFLRSGQSISTASDTTGSHRRTVFGSRVTTIPYAEETGRAEPACESAARAALRRAIARGGQRFHTEHALPISAG